MNGYPIRETPQREVSRVGVETDVKTPVLTATWSAIGANIVTVGTFLMRAFWLIGNFGWSEAGEFIASTWYMWAMALVGCWMLAFGLLSISFAVQTVDKHSPSTRKPREASDGILTAWFPGLVKLFRQDGSESRDDEDEW
jgi:hypothetical protein